MGKKDQETAFSPTQLGELQKLANDIAQNFRAFDEAMRGIAARLRAVEDFINQQIQAAQQLAQQQQPTTQAAPAAAHAPAPPPAPDARLRELEEQLRLLQRNAGESAHLLDKRFGAVKAVLDQLHDVRAEPGKLDDTALKGMQDALWKAVYGESEDEPGARERQKVVEQVKAGREQAAHAAS